MSGEGDDHIEKDESRQVLPSFVVQKWPSDFSKWIVEKLRELQDELRDEVARASAEEKCIIAWLKTAKRSQAQGEDFRRGEDQLFADAVELQQAMWN